MYSRPLACSVIVSFLLVAGCGGCRQGASTSGIPAPGKQVKSTGSIKQPDQTDPDLLPPKSDILTVRYLAIGAGNCILITTTAGKQILVDAAPSGNEQDLLNRLKLEGVQSLDYLIVTEPTAEHVGCLPALLGGMSTSWLLSPGIQTDLMSRIQGAAGPATTMMETVRAGHSEALDDETTLEVLGPAKTFNTPDAPTETWMRNHALVFRIKYAKLSLLFTGDMGPAERSQVMSSGGDLKAIAISGLHHGDGDVTDIRFIHAVKPYFAMLMCKLGNKSGFPHKSALDALKTNIVTVYRTDLQSDVTLRIRSDGELKVSTVASASDDDMAKPGSSLHAQSGLYDEAGQEAEGAGGSGLP